MGRQRRTHLSPPPSPALQPPPQHQSTRRRRRKPPKPWLMPWILTDKKGMLHQPQTSQDTRILSGCQMPFLPHRRIHTPPHQDVSHQFQEAIRGWTETGNNTKTPGYWRDLKFFAVLLVDWQKHHRQIRPQVCKTILPHFHDEYLSCPDRTAEWKKVKGKSNQIECPPHSRGNRQEAHHREDSKEMFVLCVFGDKVFLVGWFLFGDLFQIVAIDRFWKIRDF